ncbi:hypothetical protein J2S78_002067 [Salibacterium salarium]|uniref:DUF2213 domain-containing protein n=1 Tax=Salibacterium salarium TaxID=284579 RepID=UPI0027890C5B|nr:DUF2213 domain-containing protein [Salibacterium salarium]MDQ0299647.1 hypothetical protein [Salibacterium salarium]
MRHLRYDRSFVLDYEESTEGYLTVRAVVTKPGVYPYQRSDGSVQYELKHPEDIFSDQTIMSCNAKPVTDDHPREPVTVQNVKAYGKGFSHNDAAVGNGGVKVAFTVFDEDLIRKIREEGKREISLGFETELVAEDGDYNGERYQYRQTQVDVNHIAIVDKGRVGPEAAIRGDSDAWQVDSNKNNNGGGGTMPKLKIDEKEFEVPSEVKSKVDGLQAKADSYDQLKKDHDTTVANYDAQKTELDKKKKELEDAKKAEPKQDAIDSAVEARLSLIDEARNFLADDFEYKGKTDTDIKVAVIQGQDERFDAKEKSEEYVNARYDATMTFLKDTAQPATGQNNMKFTKTSTNDKLDEKRQQRLNLRDSK